MPSLPPQCWNCCKGEHTMFEEFYEMYEPEEQEVIALINRCIEG